MKRLPFAIVLLAVLVATTILTVGYAGYAAWTDPVRSAAALPAAVVIAICVQGRPRRSTVVYAGLLWILALGAYGLFLTGVSAGWCLFAACTVVVVNAALFTTAYITAPPADD